MQPLCAPHLGPTAFTNTTNGLVYPAQVQKNLSLSFIIRDEMTLCKKLCLSDGSGIKQIAKNGCYLAKVWSAHVQDTPTVMFQLSSWSVFWPNPGWLQSSGLNFDL